MFSGAHIEIYDTIDINIGSVSALALVCSQEEHLAQIVFGSTNSLGLGLSLVGACIQVSVWQIAGGGLKS